MGIKGVLLTLLALIFAVGAGTAVIGLLHWKYSSDRGTLDPNPKQAKACELEAKRPQRTVWSLQAGTLENGKWKATFKLKSDNAFDAFWLPGIQRSTAEIPRGATSSEYVQRV